MTIIHKDKAGNTLSEDADKKLAVRNADGRLVNPKEAKKFLLKKDVKRAMKHHHHHPKNLANKLQQKKTTFIQSLKDKFKEETKPLWDFKKETRWE
jgi:hypothetical protein